MSSKHPVIHFEMPAEDKKRMTDFYEKTFGWETNQLGPEFGDYIVVMTDESNKQGPVKPGVINGGFYQKREDESTHHPSVVIRVDDIASHIEKVKEAGGEVLGDPMEIPGVGTYVAFRDTEGNRVSMLQPAPEDEQVSM